MNGKSCRGKYIEISTDSKEKSPLKILTMQTQMVKVQGERTKQRKRKALRMRELVIVKKISQLMKKEESCFMILVRSSNEVPIQELKHKGMTQAVKWEIMKHTGSEKLKSVQEGKKKVLEKVA